MQSLKHVEELRRNGRFAEAVLLLNDLAIPRQFRSTVDALRVELLERTGRFAESRALAEGLLRSSTSSAYDKSVAATSLALMAADDGDSDNALQLLQRALNFAEAANDLRQVCWCQLRIMILVADRSGHEAAAPLLAQIRTNATKLGDPIVSAAIHVCVGEMDAKRGLVESAVRHSEWALRLMGDDPNLWLSAWAENTLTCAAIMRCNYAAGARHAERALALSEQSGAAGLRRASLGNLGNLSYELGEFGRAVDYFERAHDALPNIGEHKNAGLDSIALVRLAEGKLTEAATSIASIDQSIRSKDDWNVYANRHSRVAAALIHVREGNIADALDSINFGLMLAEQTGDRLLTTMASITKAEILARMQRSDDAMALLARVSGSLGDHGPHVFAHYERAMACSFAAAGFAKAGRLHLERAKRIFASLRSVPGQIEVSRSWAEAVNDRPAIDVAQHTGSIEPSTDDNNILQDVASLFLYAERSELVADAVAAILIGTAAVVSLKVISVADNGTNRILREFKSPTTDSVGSGEQTIEIEAGLSESVKIVFRPREDCEAVAKVAAIKLLLQASKNVAFARTEREERLTLWPLEDLPMDDEQAVIGGSMREVMTFARRVAGTNVSVLITGESGTGKEILARAIHGYSPRAARPFIPFNCTAVPRELLESQLFGHRRGAFTGADRDQPGLIRAAREGTLFLDEIGELGLDLQPKLLRFLESGEINPLGEPGPLTVNVRIIAATNANLEELVHAGRFREDLFYRLNVVRLTIPPLRERRDEIPALVHHFVQRAATEFSKGRVRVAEETMEHLLLYPWPGNVRQLQNELRRLVALAEPDTVLEPDALSQQIRRGIPKAARAVGAGEIAVPLNDKLQPTISKIEREMIRVALRAHQGRVDAAAKALGISRKGLYLKRQRLGL
jgi:DNA-binding NtrC family response regulator/tetratricopeptide (TPR) repeat protein